MFSRFQFPLAMVLTHRRGVGIAILRENIFTAKFHKFDKQAFYNQIKSQEPLLENQNTFEFLCFENFILSRVLGKTAENLFSLYNSSLDKLSFVPNEIKTTVVGIGPGSFTGLRLGCAFANGMKLASEGMSLLPVTTYLTPDLLQICKEMGCEAECIQALGEYELLDESTGYITFFDIVTCLLQIIEERRNFVDSLIPEYGREPGPVLKLKEGTSL